MSLHQYKDAPCSGATQGTMPSPVFYDFFKKIPTTVSRSIAQVKGFLDGGVISRKVKTTACVG
jgi:hypothetical protein